MPQPFAEAFKAIAMSPNLAESLERAHRFAREQSHRVVMLEHLLLALTEDPEAALILQSANIELARLATDVSAYLGGLMEDMRAEGGAEPRPDPELLRVLQAAASAAQQSRRRQIDGAIVLAAIVGDGKSPAAGLLKGLGMTFEEAIRALQRANTKARLKPPAKAAAGAPASAAADALPEPAAEPSANAAATGGQAPEAAADDFLAAARARIQQRSAPPVPRVETPLFEPRPAPEPEPEPEPEARPEPQPEPRAAPAPQPRGDGMSDAMRELLAVSEASHAPPPPRELPPADPLPSLAPLVEAALEGAPAAMNPSAWSSWTPPPTPHGVASMRLPPRAGPAAPYAGRQGPPGGAPRPQTHAYGTGPAGGQSRPGSRNRAPRAPWPEPGERGPPGRPAAANGHSPAGHAGPHQGRIPAAAPARGGGERGPLIENVPRRMRVGVAAAAEVRIARERVEALLVALNGRNVGHHPDGFIARALTVRLRAPAGGFSIEPASPETQWLESGAGDAINWRWRITPQRRGRAKLVLMVSARTYGHDGLASDSAPPDRVIEVKVGARHGRWLARALGWLVLLAAGAAIARFGDQLWAAADVAIKQALGG